VLIATPIAVETVRGRLRESWSWIRRAIERVRRENRIPSAFVVVEHAAHATLTAMASPSSNALSIVTHGMVRDPSDATGYFGVLTWGSRIRLHTETGDLGERFEALVAEFEAEGHDPKKAHMSLGEFYVHLAHARIHQCLHASDADRPRRLRQLRKASADLRTAARVDVYRAHALLAEGYCCWFAGHPDSARHRLRQALELAETENTPWVVAAVARARAHMLRSEGRGDAAVDQARIAAILSREHGAAHRLRAIQEEFGLHGPSVSAFRSTLSTSASSRHRSGGSRRHLRTLLHLGRASTQELDLELQGRAVVDELIESLTADRGVLFFERDPAAGRLEMIAGRTRAGEDLPEVTPQCRQVIERVRETEQPWVLPNVDGDLGGSVTEAAGAQRALAVPLWVHGRTVGVVYLDRDPSHDPFTLADSDFFETLAYQVPVALELTRVLQERAELEESLRQSQKMEALGQLAGGIAHDFNNMLTAIEGSLMALESPECTAEERAEELQTVREATERATTLTRQLLTFARRQVLAPQVYAPNDVLRDLVSILRKLVGEHIRVRLQLQDELWEVETDRGEYEQMIVNFAVNARDAMPEGGELTIGTYNVRYEHAPARELAPGRYVCTRIADTGQGMSQEVKDKIFDPFFTTKGPGDGTGLGLTTAYGFVRQHGGHIDVSSTPGTGTVFSVYLPATDRSPDEKVVRSASMPAPASGTETILLIEDEALVRRSLRRILERVGYRVLSAENGAQALEQARRHAGQIHLIVTDVLMPGMNGPQVIERLAQLPIDAPVLYISGYTDGQLVEQGVLRQGVEFVQKPFSAQSIKERVRTLLAQGKT
jgi:signal transduction histidine kinase/ActR/RegA family two-component response regulator